MLASKATLMGAETRGCVPIRKRPTTFCAPSYVSGTILPLKQGAALTPRALLARVLRAERIGTDGA